MNVFCHPGAKRRISGLGGYFRNLSADLVPPVTILSLGFISLPNRGVRIPVALLFHPFKKPVLYFNQELSKDENRF
jgi:hypothetical protein